MRAGFVLHVPDEERELPVRVLDHVGPGRVASGEVGPARPAQGREHRLGHGLDLDAAGSGASCAVPWAGVPPPPTTPPHVSVWPVNTRPPHPPLPPLQGNG